MPTPATTRATPTPGPYEVRKFKDTQTTSIYAKGWHRPIAAVRGRSPEEQEATANLFSAAPDLYAALKAVADLDLEEEVEIVQDGFVTKAISVKSESAFREARDMLRAALQKAEGK